VDAHLDTDESRFPKLDTYQKWNLRLRSAVGNHAVDDCEVVTQFWRWVALLNKKVTDIDKERTA
jgi:hypothetical protein